MKPTLETALPCAVFGHNYVISNSSKNGIQAMACRHCEKPLIIDETGDFIEDTISNKNIQSTLRKLFHINLKISKPLF